MKRINGIWAVSLLALTFLAYVPAKAWDETGHAIVTEVAIELLPADAPEFLKTAESRRELVYLSAEPDRWRNLTLAPIGHINQPDHYIDLDLLPLYELTPATLPKFRYDYVAAMAIYKAAHPEKDYHYKPQDDPQRAHEWPGFAPYRICELYVLLKSSWRTLNTYEKYADVAGEGTIEACRATIIHHMGLMSHYVGDMAQPLHSTIHHHGWVGENPKAYTTERGFHQHIDGGVIEQAGITTRSCLDRKPVFQRMHGEDTLFEEVMAYIQVTFALVEPIYELDKKGAFRKDAPNRGEGTAFIEERLNAGGVMLAALWEAARRDAGIDTFRERRLQERRRQATTQPATSPSSIP